MSDDIINRYCRKHCATASSDESEIFLDLSAVSTMAEEAAHEEEKEEEAEHFDVNAWTQELECMKRRIQLLQLHLKHKFDTCPEKPCVDLDVELTCSQNKEICALQKNQSKLQYQIEELLRCCCFTKEQIKDLRTRMCEKSKDIAQLQRVVSLLESWRETLNNEFGICLERFEYLKHVKAEWQDVLEKIETEKHCWQKMHHMFVHKNGYKRDRENFREESDNLRELFKNLCILQMERHMEMNERMSAIEQRLTKAEETAKNPIICSMPEISTKTTQDFDLNAALTFKEKFESTVPVHKIYLGHKEIYPKPCAK